MCKILLVHVCISTIVQVLWLIVQVLWEAESEESSNPATAGTKLARVDNLQNADTNIHEQYSGVGLETGYEEGREN
jgi:hypothetical protein